MDVGVNTACGDDAALAGDDFCTRANDDVHTRLGVRVASLADGGNAPAFQANVGLDDAPVVEDECIGQHGIHSPLGA